MSQVAKRVRSCKSLSATTQKDQSIVRDLDELIVKYNADFQSFVIQSNDTYLQKNEYKSIIYDSVSNDIPLCILDIITDLVYVQFDILDFLNAITEYHNSSIQPKNENIVPCKIVYNDKDECFLKFWREKKLIEFDLEMTRIIINDKIELNEINLSESTFPLKRISNEFYNEVIDLMKSQLFDCWIIRIPEPDWKLQNVVQLSDVLVVGISSNGNYVGFNCGFHGKDVFDHEE